MYVLLNLLYNIYNINSFHDEKRANAAVSFIESSFMFLYCFTSGFTVSPMTVIAVCTSIYKHEQHLPFVCFGQIPVR